MTRKLFIKTLAIVAVSAAPAIAHDMADNNQMADSSVAATSPAWNETVNCRGMDGSVDGVIKKMPRGECHHMHGNVVTGAGISGQKANR